MKKIKIILGIISALVFAFFLTGLIVKETNYTAEVFVNKSLDEVFKTFIKTGNVKNWIPEIKSIDTLKLQPNFVGSEYSILIDNQGQEIKMTQKIVAFVPKQKITFFYDAENMLKKDDFIFTEKNGNTIITLHASCQSETYLMACVFPYFKSIFKEQDQLYLNNFKVFLEKK